MNLETFLIYCADKYSLLVSSIGLVQSFLTSNWTHLFYQPLDKCQVAIDACRMQLCFSFLILPNFKTHRSPARLIWVIKLLILTLRIYIK